MSKTDQFDMALELTQEALVRVVRSQHAVGVLKHILSEWFAGERVDLVINAPTLSLKIVGGAYVAQLDTRVFYNTRDPATAGDLGDSAVADIAVMAQVSLVTGNPTLVDSTAQLQVDWTGTTAANIVVHTADAALRAKVEAALLRFMAEHGANRFVLPPIGPADEQIGALGFRFRTSGGAPILIVGMNVGPALRGNPAGITERFVSRDWALALSEGFFMSRFRDQLEEEMPLPRTVGSKCTITSFWGSCLNRTTVKLTSLNASLRDGFIKVTGNLDIHNSGALIPDATADFSAHVTLDVTSAGNIDADVGSVSVDASLFGEVLDFFSGDAFSDAIADAVKEALQSGTGGSATKFFKASTLNALAGGYTSAAVDLSPLLHHVSITSDAVTLHGDLETPQAEHEPEPAFVATELPRPDIAHRRFLFNAHASWPPGSTIAKYDWRYSDGATETFADTNCRFLTVHDFAVNPPFSLTDFILGRTRGASACLKITDVKGREEEICATLYEGRRVLVTVCIVADWIPAKFKPFRPRSPRPPLSDLVMRRAFVRAPTADLETLPLIAIENPELALRRPVGLRRDDPHAYGLGIDPLAGATGIDLEDFGLPDGERPDFAFGPIGPPEPDLDILFPREFDEFFVPVCLVSKLVPVSHVGVELVLQTGEVQRVETDEGGHAAFVVEKSKLELDKGDRASAGLARARLAVRLAGQDAQTRALWMAIAPERARYIDELRKRLMDANARFLDTVGGRAFFTSGDYRSAPEGVRRISAGAALALDRVLNILRLLQVGSAMTPIQQLVRLPRSAPPNVVHARIESLFQTIEQHTAELREPKKK